jgi:hypothetical protein
VDEIIRRWQRASERASEELVRVVRLSDAYFATSTSQPLKAYRLLPTADGWACDCVANAEYHLPCKHLAALAEALDLDVVSDTRVELPSHQEIDSAA